MTASPAQPGSERTSSSQNRLALLAMCTAVTVVVGGMTSLNLALPTIGRQTGADQSQLQWVVDIYALALAGLVLPAGALGDRFGRKRVLLVGFAILIGALAWSAFVETADQLIAGRLASGVGAALVFPATLSTITAVFPADRRGRAVGLWTGFATLGGLLGILMSAILIDSFWFGSIFLVTAAATLAAGVLTIVAVPDTRDPDEANLDPPGALLSIVAVGGIVLGITEGPVRGWSDGLTIAGLGAGLLGAGAFAAWELHAKRPLLDVRLFALRGFGAGSLSIFVQFFAVFAVLFLSVQYLAYVLSYGSLRSGVALLPLGVLLMPAAASSDALCGRFGRSRVSIAGLVSILAGLLIMAMMNTASGYLPLAVGLALLGGGVGLAAVPATEAIIESLPLGKQGVASAMNDVARELGGALSIAAIGSAFNGAYRADLFDLDALPPEVAPVVRASPALGLQAASALGAQGGSLVQTIQEAFMQGWRVAMLVAAAVTIVGTAAVAIRLGTRLHQPVSPEDLGAGVAERGI